MEEIRPKVSIIIPHYKDKERLQRLLPSIANQTFGDYEVIIIDDFSQDKSVLEYIRSFIKDYKNMRLVENTENMLFVKTCNKGIKLARGDYICLLNSDTEVKSNFVQRNVEVMDADTSIGVLSCIIVDQHGNNWFSGGIFEAGLRVNLVDDFEGVRSVDWVAGTAVFYRREVFNKVGLLDESYLMYHEDVEFGLRVRKQTDYKVCMFSEKLVTHYYQHLQPGPPSLTKMDRIAYYGHRNHILLLKRYSPKHVPKILLCNLREIIRSLPIVPILKLQPRSFLLSIRVIVLTIGGTLAGLIQSQRG